MYEPVKWKVPAIASGPLSVITSSLVSLRLAVGPGDLRFRTSAHRGFEAAGFVRCRIAGSGCGSLLRHGFRGQPDLRIVSGGGFSACACEEDHGRGS